MITVETRMHPLVRTRAYEGLPSSIGNGDAPMSYDYHIGVDYHKAYTHLVVQDSGGKVLRSGKVKNEFWLHQPYQKPGFIHDCAIVSSEANAISTSHD